MNSSEDSTKDLEIISEILNEVDLSQFFMRIKDELLLTRLSHFDNVKIEHLESIGLSPPAAERLLKAVAKKKLHIWKKDIYNRLSKIFSFPNRDGKVNQSITEERHANVKYDSQSIFLIPNEEISIPAGQKLGDGTFGVVKKGKWTTRDGRTETVAVKILKQDVYNVPGVLEDFMREVQAMHSLSHTNLIKLHGVVLSNPLMMVTELAPLGSLLDYLHKESGRISVQTFFDYSVQIARGMEFLTARRFIHRDLAARNVLMASKNKLKIGDFGLVRVLSKQDQFYVMNEQKKVPFPWCAPESLRQKKFSPASDMWMFGVTIWEIFSFGEDPWVGLNGHQILKKIEQDNERLRKPDACPEALYKILLESWCLDPAQRPSFNKVRKEILAIKLPRVSASKSSEEDGKLTFTEGDRILVIEGKSEDYMWKGQNQRTFEIGLFPRCFTHSHLPLTHQDISKPIPESYMHTAHRGPKGRWGKIDCIDDMILRAPLRFHDISSSPTTISSEKSRRSAKHSTKKTKHLSLWKKKTRAPPDYSQLDNERGRPNDGSNAGSDSKIHEHSDIPLISFADAPGPPRQRSYSASDLRKSPNQASATAPAHHFEAANPTVPRPAAFASRPVSAFVTYGNVVPDVASSELMYQNISNQFSSNTLPLRVPVRPAPPVNLLGEARVAHEVHPAPTQIYDSPEGDSCSSYQYYPEDDSFDDDDEWDDTESFDTYTPDTGADGAVYSNIDPIGLPSEASDMNDPFDTSNVPVYLDTPNERIAVCDTNNDAASENTAASAASQSLKKLENQIGDMWLSNVAKDDNPNDKNLINFNAQSSTSSNLNTLSNAYLNNQIKQTPSKNKNVSFSPCSKDLLHNSRTSIQTSLSLLSQSTPTLIPKSDSPATTYYNNQFPILPAAHKESNMPKLDPSFIVDLEKKLGKDQAAANTFNFLDNKDTSNMFDSMSPRFQGSNATSNAPQNLQPGSLNRDKICNNQVLASVNPNSGASNTAFDDLDLLSSSRKLGLAQSGGGVDMSEFFKKSNNKKVALSNMTRNILPTNPQYQPNVLMSYSALNQNNAAQLNQNLIPFSPKFTGNHGATSADFRETVNAFSSFFENQRSSPQANVNAQKATADVTHSTFVVSPQVTVNYNQMVCASGGGALSDPDKDACNPLVGRVAAMVPGTSLTAAKQALHVASGDFKSAVEFLKEEKLYRLGITDKINCRKILEENNWELERSASILLDKFS